jgi:hypothetical protein
VQGSVAVYRVRPKEHEFVTRGLNGFINFIYLCIYCLFNDAVSVSDYIASNDRMIMKWKTFGSGHGLMRSNALEFDCRD